jgi:hypothetical protein
MAAKVVGSAKLAPPIKKPRQLALTGLFNTF